MDFIVENEVKLSEKKQEIRSDINKFNSEYGKKVMSEKNE